MKFILRMNIIFHFQNNFKNKIKTSVALVKLSNQVLPMCSQSLHPACSEKLIHKIMKRRKRRSACSGTFMVTHKRVSEFCETLSIFDFFSSLLRKIVLMPVINKNQLSTFWNCCGAFHHQKKPSPAAVITWCIAQLSHPSFSLYEQTTTLPRLLYLNNRYLQIIPWR